MKALAIESRDFYGAFPLTDSTRNKPFDFVFIIDQKRYHYSNFLERHEFEEFLSSCGEKLEEWNFKEFGDLAILAAMGPEKMANLILTDFNCAVNICKGYVGRSGTCAIAYCPATREIVEVQTKVKEEEKQESDNR